MSIPRGRLTRLLALGLAVVSGAGLAIELIHSGSHAPIVEALLELLSLSFEANLPTWYAAALLLGCGLSMIGIAGVGESANRRHWLALSAIFFYISLDEVAQLHERLGGLVGGSGVLYFDWVVPASVIVALLGVAFLPFLFRLEALERRRFVIAGIIYVCGALAMELPLGYVAESRGDDNLTYALIDWVEESLELAGASLFLASLEDYRARLLSGEAS